MPASINQVTKKKSEMQQPTLPLADASRVNLTAKLLMSGKYGLMDDLNYEVTVNNGEFNSKEPLSFPQNNGRENTDDPIDSPYSVRTPPTARNTFIDPKQVTVGKKTIIPKSTRVNADRVRVYLDCYYAVMERSLRSEEDIKEEELGEATQNKPHPIHEGVECVYNPLQTIRNRKLRKKYNNLPPRSFFLGKPPLIAVKQFSRKPNHSIKWFVDISEKTSDLIWRTSYWDELVDPHGELWFGSKKSSLYRHGRPGSSHHLHLRPHRSISPVSSKFISPPKFRRQNSDLESHISSADSSTSHSSQRHDEDAPQTAPHYLEVGPPSDKSARVPHTAPANESERSRLNRFEQLITKKSKRWSKSPTLHRKSHRTMERPVLHLNGKSLQENSMLDDGFNTLPTTQYMTPVTEDAASKKSGNSLAIGIPIRSLKKKSSTASSDEHMEVPFASQNELLPTNASARSKPLSIKNRSNLTIDKTLQKYWKDLRYISSTFAVMNHRKATHDIVKVQELRRRNMRQVDNDMDEVVKATFDSLEAYNKKLDTVLKEGNQWNSKWLNDYSVRVETLISTTDRIMSDINTTLTLKLKLFQENADKYESLKAVRSRRVSKFAYILLEYLIVIILWSIWFTVCIFRNIRQMLLILVKVLKWMLC